MNNNNPLSTEEQRRQEFVKQGYMHLKPMLVEFLRCVHVQSEKQSGGSGGNAGGGQGGGQGGGGGHPGSSNNNNSELQSH